TARYSERAPTPTTSRPSATAAAASANASAGTAIVPCESPNASSEPRATTKAGISSGAASPRRTMPTAGVPGGAWSGTGASMSSHPPCTAVSARSDGTSGSPAGNAAAATIPWRPASGTTPAGSCRSKRCSRPLRCPAGTATARYVTSAVGGGESSAHAETATTTAPASHLSKGGRSSHSTPRTYGTGLRQERGSVVGGLVARGIRLAAARARVGDVVTRSLEDDATGVDYLLERAT